MNNRFFWRDSSYFSDYFEDLKSKESLCVCVLFYHHYDYKIGKVIYYVKINIHQIYAFKTKFFFTRNIKKNFSIIKVTVMITRLFSDNIKNKLKKPITFYNTLLTLLSYINSIGSVIRSFYYKWIDQNTVRDANQLLCHIEILSVWLMIHTACHYPYFQSIRPVKI